MEPITDVREISRIAYGFMASKALFASLNLDLYSKLSRQPKTLETLSQETGIASNRLLKLLTACVSLGLLTKDGNLYANAPASETYLVRGARAYFGDYFRFQTDRQLYPLFEHLDTGLRGGTTPNLYDVVATNPEEADHFSRAQHTGSLGPAYVMAKTVDLSGCRKLLDVAGGSGAFSITFCRRHSELTATIIDFPNVIEVAKRFVTEAGLGARINYIPGNALDVEWPTGQDVVLMSYLVSAVAETDITKLLDHAYHVLKPNGQLLLHDFMVQDDQSGPTIAALCLLGGVVGNLETALLTPEWLTSLTSKIGFTDISVQDLIPGTTKLLVARKPLGN
jgi:SAM-dependent methyltransferase